MVDIDITLIFQVINMLALMFILNGVLYKPVRKILKERFDRLQALQGEISQFEKDALSRQAEVDSKMAQASGKAKAALDQARAGAQADGDARVAAIKAEADKRKEEELSGIRSQVDSARAGLQANLDSFAADMAAKILGRSIKS